MRKKNISTGNLEVSGDVSDENNTKEHTDTFIQMAEKEVKKISALYGNDGARVVNERVNAISSVFSNECSRHFRLSNKKVSTTDYDSDRRDFIFKHRKEIMFDVKDIICYSFFTKDEINEINAGLDENNRISEKEISKIEGDGRYSTFESAMKYGFFSKMYPDIRNNPAALEEKYKQEEDKLRDKYEKFKAERRILLENWNAFVICAAPEINSREGVDIFSDVLADLYDRYTSMLEENGIEMNPEEGWMFEEHLNSTLSKVEKPIYRIISQVPNGEVDSMGNVGYMSRSEVHRKLNEHMRECTGPDDMLDCLKKAVKDDPRLFRVLERLTCSIGYGKSQEKYKEFDSIDLQAKFFKSYFHSMRYFSGIGPRGHATGDGRYSKNNEINSIIDEENKQRKNADLNPYTVEEESKRREQLLHEDDNIERQQTFKASGKNRKRYNYAKHCGLTKMFAKINKASNDGYFAEIKVRQGTSKAKIRKIRYENALKAIRGLLDPGTHPAFSLRETCNYYNEVNSDYVPVEVITSKSGNELKDAGRREFMEICIDMFRDRYTVVPNFADAETTLFIQLGHYYEIKAEDKLEKNDILGFINENKEIFDYLYKLTRKEMLRMEYVKRRIDEGKPEIGYLHKNGQRFHYITGLNNRIDEINYILAGKIKDKDVSDANRILNRQNRIKAYEDFLYNLKPKGIQRMYYDQREYEKKKESFLERYNNLLNSGADLNVLAKELDEFASDAIPYDYFDKYEEENFFNKYDLTDARLQICLIIFEEMEKRRRHLRNYYIRNGGNPDSLYEYVEGYRISDNMLRRFFYNTFIGQCDLVQMLMVDPAFCKNTTDFQKCFKQFYSPVTYCYTSYFTYDKAAQTGDMMKDLDLFKVTPSNKILKYEYSITLADSEVRAQAFSAAKKYCEKMLKAGRMNDKTKNRILSALDKITETNGQTYRTLESYRSVLLMLGKSSRKADEVIGKLIRISQSERRGLKQDEANTLTQDDIDTMFNVLKPFVSSYETEWNAGGTKLFDFPIQHKNAEFLLIADIMLGSCINQSPELVALSRFMRDHMIDKANFVSTVKVGAKGVIDTSEDKNVMRAKKKGVKQQYNKQLEDAIYAAYEQMTGLGKADDGTNYVANYQTSNGGYWIGNDYVHRMLMDDLGESTPLNEHLLSHSKSDFGTQAAKIMQGAEKDAEITVSHTGTGETQTYKGETYNKMVSRVFNEMLCRGFMKLSKKYSSPRAIKDYMYRKLTDRGMATLDVLKYLQLDEAGNFKYPWWDPMIQDTFQSILISDIRKVIMAHPMRMAVLPQVTSYGLDDKLHVRWRDSKGNIIPTKEELNMSDDEYERYIEGVDVEAIDHVEVAMPLHTKKLISKYVDRNGYLRISKVSEEDREAFEAIGYRVPTEGLHSIVPLRIVQWLPTFNASCVILPAEWMAISGSGMDSDKLYTLFREIRHTGIAKMSAKKQNEIKAEIAKGMFQFDYIVKSGRKKMQDEKGKENVSKSKRLDTAWQHAVTERNELQDRQLDKFAKGICEWFYANGLYTDMMEPVKFVFKETERMEGESEYNFQMRRLDESLSMKDESGEYVNGPSAMNNLLFDMFTGFLKSRSNTQRIITPSDAPNLTEITDIIGYIENTENNIEEIDFHLITTAEGKTEFLKKAKDNGWTKSGENMSIADPYTRMEMHERSMSGKKTLPVFAIYNCFYYLMLNKGMTLKSKYNISINQNRSLVKGKERLYTIGNVFNNNLDDILSNNQEGITAAANNYKEQKLGMANINKKSAPLAIYLIFVGYSIDEVVLFMKQPVIRELYTKAFNMNANVNEIFLNSFYEDYLKKSNNRIFKSAFAPGKVRIAGDLFESGTPGISISSNTLGSYHMATCIRMYAESLDDGSDPTRNDIYMKVQLGAILSLAKILPAVNSLNTLVQKCRFDTKNSLRNSFLGLAELEAETLETLQDEKFREKLPFNGLEEFTVTYHPTSSTAEDVKHAVGESPAEYAVAHRSFTLGGAGSIFGNISSDISQSMAGLISLAKKYSRFGKISDRTAITLRDAYYMYMFSDSELVSRTIETLKSEGFEIENFADLYRYYSETFPWMFKKCAWSNKNYFRNNAFLSRLDNRKYFYTSASYMNVLSLGNVPEGEVAQIRNAAMMLFAEDPDMVLAKFNPPVKGHDALEYTVGMLRRDLCMYNMLVNGVMKSDRSLHTYLPKDHMYTVTPDGSRSPDDIMDSLWYRFLDRRIKNVDALNNDVTNILEQYLRLDASNKIRNSDFFYVATYIKNAEETIWPTPEQVEEKYPSKVKGYKYMLAGDEAGNAMFFKKEYNKGIKQYVWMRMPGFAMSGTYQYGSDKPISPTLDKEDIPRYFYLDVKNKISKYYFEQDSKFYKENEDLYKNDRKLYKELEEKNTEKIFHELVKMANDWRDEKGNVIAKRFRVKIIQVTSKINLFSCFIVADSRGY